MPKNVLWRLLDIPVNVEGHAYLQGPVHAQGIPEKALISLTDDESLHKLKMKTKAKL